MRTQHSRLSTAWHSVANPQPATPVARREAAQVGERLADAAANGLPLGGQRRLPPRQVAQPRSPLITVGVARALAHPPVSPTHASNHLRLPLPASVLAALNEAARSEDFAASLGDMHKLVALLAVFLLRYAGVTEGAVHITQPESTAQSAASTAPALTDAPAISVALVLLGGSKLADVRRQLGPKLSAPATSLLIKLAGAAEQAATMRDEPPALALHLQHQGGAWQLNLVGVAGQQSYASRWRRNWSTWLRGVRAQPAATVWAWPMVSRSEQSLLARWNDTAVQVPGFGPHTTLHACIEQQVDKTPSAIAVVFEGQTLTYSQLDQAANQLAQRLMALGVAPGQRVGVFLERAPHMVVAMLATWKAGGAYLPLEPDFPDQRLHNTVQDSTPVVVVTTAALRHRLPGGTAVLCLHPEGNTGLADSNAIHGQSPRPRGLATASDCCYVIYTSGSTGAPKGAMLPHRAICNHMAWMTRHHGLQSSDHVLQKTPFSFDASVWEFLAPLLTGARIVLARPGGHRDMPYLAQTIKQHDVTTLQLVPSVLQLLVEEPAFANCHSLKRVFCGGEALTTALAQRFFSQLPGVELINLYGPTECCIDTTTFVCDPAVASPVQPIGYPVWNTTHHVLDEQQMPVPMGTPGELYIGGAGLALGYLNRHSLTAERFVHLQGLAHAALSPAAGAPTPARYYRTGDRVRLQADGSYAFIGRVDFQVKLNGFRIELGEIEAVLERHPQVAQAVAMLREDRPGHRYLAAYVALRPSLSPSADDLPQLQKSLRAHLAAYLPSHMMPAVCEVLPVLPLTHNGKVDRKALPQPQWLNNSQSAGQKAATGLASASSITQAALWEVWADLLGSSQFGVDDDFFALGGDSLGLMQLGLALRERWNIDVTPDLLFEATTVRSLAAHLDEVLARGDVAQPPVQAAQVSGGAAPDQPSSAAASDASSGVLASIEQKSYAAVARSLRTWPLFNTSEVLHFTRPLALATVQQAVDAVVARHATLRTQVHFVATPSGHAAQGTAPAPISVQHVVPAAPVPVQVVNQPNCSAAELQTLLQQAVQQPLDLQNQLPSRWLWVEGGAAGQWLIAIVHHSMTDAWSTDLWVQDLLEQCAPALGDSTQAAVSATKAASPATSYASYAAQQHQRLMQGGFDVNRNYWHSVLAGPGPAVQLPSDRPRRAIARWQGGRESLLLQPALRLQLKAVAAQHKASLYMVLLSAFAVLLHEQTQQHDLVVGTSVNNRHAAGLGAVVGCLIGALPLRLRMPQTQTAAPQDSSCASSAPATWAQLLLQARQVCMDAYRHQDLPLGMAFEPLAQPGVLVAGAPVPVWLELHDQQHSSAQRFGHLGVQRVDLDRGISESEFSLEVDDCPSGLLCHAQYKTSLFDASRVQALLARFETLLAALAQDPSAALPIQVGQLPDQPASQQAAACQP